MVVFQVLTQARNAKQNTTIPVCPAAATYRDAGHTAPNATTNSLRDIHEATKSHAIVMPLTGNLSTKTCAVRVHCVIEKKFRVRDTSAINKRLALLLSGSLSATSAKMILKVGLGSGYVGSARESAETIYIQLLWERRNTGMSKRWSSLKQKMKQTDSRDGLRCKRPINHVSSANTFKDSDSVVTEHDAIIGHAGRMWALRLFPDQV